MTTPTDDRRDLLTVVAYMKAAPGKEAELKSALEALIEPTKQEDGYVTYDLHQNLEDQGSFVFYENWESADALEAHFATPHLVDFVARTDDLLDEKGLTLLRLQRIA